MSGDVSLERDVEVGRWLQRALHRDATVASVVPDRFAAYARILHPATLSTPTGGVTAWGVPEYAVREIGWRESAELLGREWPGEYGMWRELAGEQQRELADGRRLDEPVADGEPPLEVLSALMRTALAVHGEAEVVLGLWVGSGFDPSSSTAFMLVDDPALTRDDERRMAERATAALQAAIAASIDPAVRRAIDAGELLGLPAEGMGREHVLLRGALGALTDPRWVETAGLGWRPATGEGMDAVMASGGRLPNIVWPAEPAADPAWLAATDIDADSTIVGGSAAFIGAVLGNEQLEAVRVRPTDRVL